MESGGCSEDLLANFFRVKTAVAGAEAQKRCHQSLQPLQTPKGVGGQQLQSWEGPLEGKAEADLPVLQPTQQALSGPPPFTCSGTETSSFTQLAMLLTLSFSLMVSILASNFPTSLPESH